jgi:hypothetical protein
MQSHTTAQTVASDEDESSCLGLAQGLGTVIQRNERVTSLTSSRPFNIAVHQRLSVSTSTRL